jgi:hypothetical protein
VQGDGEQTHSFTYMYSHDCSRATRGNLVHVGSDEKISINNLAKDEKNEFLRAGGVGTEGIRPRDSDDRLIPPVLGWTHQGR